MTLAEFGRDLILTGDLDPVYIALYQAGLEKNQLRRWLLAYWCSYHSGVSCFMSEKIDHAYWEAMHQYALNVDPPHFLGGSGRWPRGRERRHFRGAAAIKSVSYLADTFPHPHDAVSSLETATSYQDVLDRTKAWPLFGRWIAFKIADMLERVCYYNVVIDSGAAYYEAPTEAARDWLHNWLPDEPYDAQAAIRAATVYLQLALGVLDAPPRHDRKVNHPEFETILCKYGSYKHHHYHVGQDIAELHEALEPWCFYSETAHRMLKVAPPIVQAGGALLPWW